MTGDTRKWGSPGTSFSIGEVQLNGDVLPTKALWWTEN